MSISASIAPVTPAEDFGESVFKGRACFGTFNCMHMYSVTDINGDSLRQTNLRDRTSEIEVINFWPHNFYGVPSKDIERALVEATDIFNSMSCYKDMFSVTSVNSIAVNLRNHPADKVFTGLMTIRSYLDGDFNGMEFLQEGVQDKEELLKRQRIGLALRLAGLSRNFFGRWCYSNDVDSTDESAATYFDGDMSAIAFLPLICTTDEFSENVWVQNVFGVDDNRDGYVRNHNDGVLRRMARRRDQDPDHYESMSEWLRLWSTCAGHKREVLDQRMDRITVRSFIERLMQAVPSSMTPEEAGARVVSLFDELVEYYND
ncbi:hypothetical protein [Escherichia phage vB_EcoP_PAS59]|uniref:Uncharacterized protein n=1 Tax=Escherichia phage vB_EcoP_PAS59 TaxID=3053873 RepID=A0AA51VHI1_9CAUD|nr:hypothetical protein [Escherichia phage vB_EcoP_PAS59]